MKMTTCTKHKDDYIWDAEQFQECPQCTADRKATAEAADFIEISPEDAERFEELSDQETAIRMLARDLTLQQRKAVSNGRKVWKEFAAKYGFDVSKSPYYYDGKVVRKGFAPNQAEAT